MDQNKRSLNAGMWKVVSTAVVCLLIGLGAGKWFLTTTAVAKMKSWQSIEELYQMYSVPDSYNIVESNKSYEVELMSLIHDRLYNYDPLQKQLMPALAKAYEVSGDGRTWTFHLRPAATANGTQLTAEDVVFSVTLCLDERFNCKRRGNLKIGNKYIVAKAKGPLTVSFELTEPYPCFLWSISDVMIIPKVVFQPIASSVEDFRRAVNIQQPALKFLAGFGPYYVESQDTQEIRLVRNERFWGRGDELNPKPYLKRIVLSLRKTGTTLEMDFLHNDRFIYRIIGPGEAKRIRENSDFQVVDRGLSGWCMFFWVNQNLKAPLIKNDPSIEDYPKKFNPAKLELFRNENFRRAVVRLVDREEIVRRVFKGYADPLYGPISPVYPWAASSETLKDLTPSQDTALALAELAKLGVTPGEPDDTGKRWLTYEVSGKRIPLVIELRTSQAEEDLRKKTAEVIKEQFSKAGIQVNVVEESFRDIVRRLDETFDYEAALMFLEGSANAATARNMFESSGDMHFFHPYQQPEERREWEKQVDKLFKVFATSMDAATQQNALTELQKIWVSAQPVFYLLNDRKLVAIRHDYEVNGIALTGQATDPILMRTFNENVHLRRLVGK